MGNLLGNAAKFAGRGGLARVRVSTDPATKHPTIVVADSGAGMTEETLAHLFEPFMQGESTLDRSKGGLGLGLHGGHIRAHSDGAGQGAEFVVSLPDDQVEAAPAETTVPSHTITCRRVLIIEDNIDAADSLREALELDAHQVAVAHDGPAGLALARSFHPEVVLCDVGLPGMTGYDVARAFRADQVLKRTFLVAVTGYATCSMQARRVSTDIWPSPSVCKVYRNCSRRCRIAPSNSRRPLVAMLLLQPPLQMA